MRTIEDEEFAHLALEFCCAAAPRSRLAIATCKHHDSVTSFIVGIDEAQYQELSIEIHDLSIKLTACIAERTYICFLSVTGFYT
jgi:hypothetical protein